MTPVSINNPIGNKELYVEIIIGTTCNFKCSYCFKGCHDGRYRWPDVNDTETLKNNLSHMFDQYKIIGKEKINLHFIGGEPTLWPQLEEVATYFKENYNVRTIMSTNGSRTLRYWKKISKSFDLINFSIHNEECDPDHLIEVMDWIYLNTDTVIAGGLLMDPKNWDRCEKITSKLETHPVPWLFNIRPIQGEETIVEYTPEQIEYLSKQNRKTPPENYRRKMDNLGKIRISKSYAVFDDKTESELSTLEFFQKEWNKFKGWECNLGVDRFIIGADGRVTSSCDADHLFNLTEQLNIYDKNLTNKFSITNIKPLLCKKEFCRCTSEIKLTKKKV